MISSPDINATGDLSREDIIATVDAALAASPVGLVVVELWVEGPEGEPVDPTEAARHELNTRLARTLDDNDELLAVNVDRQIIIKRRMTAPAETEGFALRLLNALGGPVHVGRSAAVCHATIGVAVSHASDCAADLVRYAEHALADAHLLGGDMVVCFEDADRALLLDE